jgi:mediator of RNA polymerase II transcription subunit 16, fungi type
MCYVPEGAASRFSRDPPLSIIWLIKVARMIAWSRTGTIASIQAGGRELVFRHLRARPLDGSWDLSEPTTCDFVQGTTSNPLVHLEWAATSSPELAVFDSVGRVMVISFTIALNHPFLLRNWQGDSVDNLNAAAGCYWLPLAPPQPQVRKSMYYP